MKNTDFRATSIQHFVQELHAYGRGLITVFEGIVHAAVVMSLIYLVGLAATLFARTETKGKPLPA